MNDAAQFDHDLALLDWHLELGADEAVGETPINRYELEAPAPKPKPAPVAPVILIFKSVFHKRLPVSF